ncbi:UNVERIFIED_CONTAM: hypothetical protein HDU68_008111, partial [Siphonaria sp. JEL0065]
VIVTILLVIGILVGFYFPRFPETKVYDIDLTNLAGSSSAFHFSYLDNSTDLNKLVILMNLTMNVGTFNPNLYGLNVDSIDLVAQMMVNQSYVYDQLKTRSLTSYGALVQVVGKPPTPPEGYYGRNDSVIGTAHSTSSLYFPKRTWLNYTMTFQLKYSPDPSLGILADPTVLELADACGITSRYKPPGRSMKIHYVATSSISSLKTFGYAPSLENNLYIICPFDITQINAVISYVGQGLDVMDALKVVFEGAPLSSR